MRNFFSRPSPEPVPEDQAPQRPMSQRPAPRASRSAAALFAAYGALGAASTEGCSTARPEAHTAYDARAEETRRIREEQRRLERLPIVTISEVRHHIYGSFDPADPNREEIPANAAAGSQIIRTSQQENEPLPAGLMSPLSSRSPEDPTPDRYVEGRHHSANSSQLRFSSTEKRLHEGGLSFAEVIRDAVRTHGTLLVTYRSAAVHDEGTRSYTQTPTGPIIFNWDTAIMEPIRTPTEIRNAQRRAEHVSYHIPARVGINAALYNLCHRVTMPPNTPIHSRLSLEGRLPGARSQITVHNREAQVLLQNIDIHRESEEGEEVWVISGDRTFIYASAPPSTGE